MQERVSNMDITSFMAWFLNQVVSIFSWFFSTLDSITFAGTSLLRVSVTIVILVPLVGVFLTLVKNPNVTVSRSERVSDNDSKHKAEVTNVRVRH